MKQFNDILALVARYAPILVIHVLLIVWLKLRVFNPEQAPTAEMAWAWLSGNIDRSLTAAGASTQRWYVILALLIAYFTAFDWLRTLVVNLPVLRPPFRSKPAPLLIAQACEVLRMRPDYWSVFAALQDLTDTASRKVREANAPHPYQWLFDREGLWRRYYGTLLIALFAALAWALAGAPLAPSNRIWELVTILALVCLAVRYWIGREVVKQRTTLGYWALREYARGNADRPDPAASTRFEMMREEAEAAQALEALPARRIIAFSHRLPERLGKWLRERIKAPRGWYIDRDWELVASQKLTIADETVTPPIALRVENYVSQFAALLEAPGTGLCALAPLALGRAPGVPAGGSAYAFATRCHGNGYLGIDLIGPNLDNAKLYVQSHYEADAFIAELGPHPIALLAQFNFPSAAGKDPSPLIYAELPEQSWKDIKADKSVTALGLKLAKRAELHSGSSYMLCTRTDRNTRAGAVLQCFRGPDETLLVAWRILHVDSSKVEAPDVPRLWQPSAWKDLIRQKEEHAAKA